MRAIWALCLLGSPAVLGFIMPARPATMTPATAGSRPYSVRPLQSSALTGAIG